MKKKTIIILFLSVVFIIVLSLGIEHFNQQDSTPDSRDKLESTPQEELAEEKEQFLKKDSDNKAPKTPAEGITREFAEAIESTINFFSGKERHIVAIGDSLTQGVGDSTKQGGYVGILDKHLNSSEKVVTFDNLGKRGNRTDHLMKRLEKPEIKESIKSADIIIITIGANDIMQVVKENFMDITYDVFSEERTQYENRLQKIMETLKKQNPNASVYLIGFYNPFQQYFEHIKELEMIVEDWNNTSMQVAERNGAVFVPTKDLFLNENDNLFADDHFHPNNKGYRLIAERILNYLVIE